MTDLQTRICTRRGCSNEVAGRWKWYESCRAYQREKQAEHRSRQDDNGAGYQREFHRRRRVNVIAHYGGKCACCGESEFEFLVIDHIDGGGSKHRVEVGSGTNFVGWLLANNLPDGFRVLCHNCNGALGHYGHCPHERGKLSLVSEREAR